MNLLKTVNITLLLALVALFNSETTWAQPQEVTFNFTGGQQSFVVPDRVFSIHIQAWGAQGANGMGPSQTIGLGGLGGFSEGDLSVTPGQTLAIFVGGQGIDVGDEIGGGGFNGGGNAGGFAPNNRRGGGGGASDVRVGGTTFNERVIVAAGGGGGCGSGILDGGAGGGLNGQDGENEPGSGGTQTNGGDGGGGEEDGQFGIGGSDDQPFPNGNAGGGGGWYGGGAACGAGGGSSYIGGVDNGTTSTGLREGDGLIVLTFTPLVRNIPTLSEWGLIAMACILGIAGFIVIRRRKVAA